MAFNPFNAFRKHQKVLFAVLTIACMFVFVLQFGRGDILERLAGWFGGGRARGEFVATVDGKKVYTGELEGPRGLRLQRTMANTFILGLMRGEIDSVLEDPRAKNDKMDRRLQELLLHVRYRDQQQQFMLATSQDLKDVQDLQTELKGKDGNESEIQYLDEVAGAIKIQQSLLFLRSGYYGGKRSPEGTVYFSLDDLLDFRLWENQANKLGIVLTEDAVRLLVKRDTGGREVLPEGSFRASEKYKRMMGGFNRIYANITEAQIVDALAAEYRVILAQEALLGEALSYKGPGGVFGQRQEHSPVTITPGQFLQYFREQRTTVKAALLPLSVADFEKDVTGEPNDAELRELYDRYKNDEPSPAQAYPGFKEPRSVRVQYLTASAKSEFYQNLVKNIIPASAMADVNFVLVRQVAAGFGSYPTGGGAGAWAMTTGMPLASDYVLQEYNKYSVERTRGVTAGYNVSPEVYEPSYDAASALGYILSGITQGNPAAAPAALTNTNRAHAIGQARAAGAAILAGTSPTPGLAGLLQVTTDYAQPLDKVGPYLVDRAREKAAKELLFFNIVQFSRGLDKERATPKSAETFIAKTAKEDAFHLHEMKTARDALTLPEDPALKDLVQAFAKPQRRPAPITKKAALAEALLRANAPFQTALVDELNEMDWTLMRLPDEWCLYWLVENNLAKVRSFAAAKPDVVKAWKRMQARKLALKAAKAIEAKVREQQWPEDGATRQREVMAFLARQQYGQPFVLDKIARQVEQDSPNPGLSKLYKPYAPPEADIKYPPEKFADTILGLQKPGAATWLEDRPATTLYVAVLLERQEPSYNDFLRTYRDSLSDTLWSSYVNEERENFKKKFVENMREQAAPGETENGQWKLPAGLRRGTSGSEAE